MLGSMQSQPNDSETGDDRGHDLPAAAEDCTTVELCFDLTISADVRREQREGCTLYSQAPTIVIVVGYKCSNVGV